MTKDSDPPTKKDVLLAAWQATVMAKLENIEQVVTTPDPEVLHNTKRLDTHRNISLAIVVAILGLLAALLTTCTQQTERAVETRTTVMQHGRDIDSLRTAVMDINTARAQDTERVVKAIEDLRTARVVSESGVDCRALNSEDRNRLRALLHNPALCAEDN